MYGNKVLGLPESTLGSYGVGPNSTLFFMSFRPHGTEPGVWYAKHLSQSSFAVRIDGIVVEIPEAKERAERIHFILSSWWKQNLRERTNSFNPTS
jgi:hypothetical protein